MPAVDSRLVRPQVAAHAARGRRIGPQARASSDGEGCSPKEAHVTGSCDNPGEDRSPRGWKNGVRLTAVSSDEVRALIDLVDSPHTAPSVRKSAAALRPLATSSPSRALEELQAIAEVTVSRLDTRAPTTILYRAVAIPTFHRYCTSVIWRPPAISYEIFRREVESSPDPGAFLLDTLDRTGVIFPRSHSWLAEGDILRSLDGKGLVQALQLDKQEPPFALCVLTPARMVQSGVEIRTPNALDAVLGRHVVWRASGVPAGKEYVDLDILGEAVEEIQWRP